MDPSSLLLLSSTVGSWLISSATAGLVGSEFDKSICQVWRKVVERSRSEQPPVNHDLQKALRKAYLQATIVICGVLYQEWNVHPQQWRRSRHFYLGHQPEITKLDEIREALRQKLGQIPNAISLQNSKAIAKAEEQIEWLLQPRDRTGEQIIQELQTALKEELLNELRQNHGELPERFCELVRDGWSEAEVHLDWFDLFCAFFAQELKTNESVRSIFEGKLLAELKGEMSALNLSVENFQAGLIGLNQELTQRFVRVEEQLNQLRSESRDIATVQERLDQVLPQLVLGTDSLSEEIEKLRRELRRRPLYEQYPVREVQERVEQIARGYTDLFVGREPEYQQIDRFIGENGSGVLLVTAGAGLGKSALLANWKERRQGDGCYIAYHCFKIQFEVTRSVRSSYRHLLQQLYVYYRPLAKF